MLGPDCRRLRVSVLISTSSSVSARSSQVPAAVAVDGYDKIFRIKYINLLPVTRMDVTVRQELIKNRFVFFIMVGLVVFFGFFNFISV